MEITKEELDLLYNTVLKLEKSLPTLQKAISGKIEIYYVRVSAEDVVKTISELKATLTEIYGRSRPKVTLCGASSFYRKGPDIFEEVV
jgi:translation initiation factor IF-1